MLEGLERKKKEKELEKLKAKDNTMDINFETAAQSDIVYEEEKLKALKAE